MKQRTAEIIIVIVIILISLWLMSTPGGRSTDYQEQQMDDGR